MFIWRSLAKILVESEADHSLQVCAREIVCFAAKVSKMSNVVRIQPLHYVHIQDLVSIPVPRMSNFMSVQSLKILKICGQMCKESCLSVYEVALAALSRELLCKT